MWDISEAKYGFKSESCALVYLETGKIYSKKEDYEKAVEYQKRAISNIFHHKFLNDRHIG